MDALTNPATTAADTVWLGPLGASPRRNPPDFDTRMMEDQ